MVIWTNSFAPGWIFVKRKPHPMGNEYHCIACGQTKIIFWIELVEGKDHPPEIPIPFVEQGKTVGLLLRMTESIWFTERVVVLDSAFGIIHGLVALLSKGIYTSMVIKKKRYWPAMTEGQAAIDYMNEKEFGSTSFRKGCFQGKEFYLEATKDSKITRLMLHSYGATEFAAEPRKRRVDGQIKDIHFSVNLEHYFAVRHACDDNNNLRQGSLSLEENWRTKRWDVRQLCWIIALCETNSCLMYNEFFRKPKRLELISLSEFRREVAEEVLSQYHEKGPDETSDTSSTSQFRASHELVKKPENAGIWNGESWTKVSQKYTKTRCRGEGCMKKVRTHCSCSESLILCNGCHAIHYKDAFSTEY